MALTAAVTLALAGLILGTIALARHQRSGRASPPSTESVRAPGGSPGARPEISRSFSDTFRTSGTLAETGGMGESASPNWWLNSGGLVSFLNGYGQTIQGALPANSRWRQQYDKNNPADTDGGLHPQNIFRLVTRSRFRQLRQEVFFRVDADELSPSSQRAASNGVLLFNRYQDGNNLYYTGLRVDGHAVIKKKQSLTKGAGGTYFTMAEKPVFEGEYNRATKPNLLPKQTWIGLRSVVTTLANGTVDVQLWSDLGKTGNWQPLLEATDDGRGFGGAPITADGYGGVRTDFMDVSLRQYSISELNR
ncbi:MAG: hypothetical protein JWN01_438 [Patescibacteria group bacterium]|nr:hypothetical protein [Patescibacteria group bacterium]